MHALIVAGPSGAGKSTFLRELQAGRLAADIRRHLPEKVATWRVLDCCRPEHWESFLTDTGLASETGGITVHYDITSKWWKLKQDFARDPTWQVLRQCEEVTLVLMRPSLRQLLVQWSGRLGMRPWKVHARKMLAWSAPLLLAGVRRLRIARHSRLPERTRYPRPLRFLKRVDRALRSYCKYRTFFFDLYRRRESVEQMLRSWDEVAAAKIAAVTVMRIDLVPDPAAKIGEAFGWRIKRLEPMEAPATVRKLSFAG